MLLHPTIEEISRLLDGMLEEKRQVRLYRHLSGCTGCREKQEALLKVKGTLADLPIIEEAVLKPAQLPPIGAPEISHALQWKGLGVGVGIGLGLVGFLFLRPAQPELKVISSSTPVSSSQGALGSKVSTTEAIQTLSQGAGHVDLEIPGQVYLRLKPGTTLSWQRVDRSWLSRRPQLVVSLLRGELLVRTQEGFWGSRLQVRTPTATSFVKGTAFSVKVEPTEESTVLKVLAGKVFFSPHLEKVGVDVANGQVSRIRSERLPVRPQALSTQERLDLLETYRIGIDPQAALVVGGEPERVEELLKPCLLYLSDRTHPEVHPFLRKVVEKLNAALLTGDPAKEMGALKILEMTLEHMKDKELAVPLRLYAGATWVRLGEPRRAMGHFRWVMEETPGHPQAGLAGIAAGVVAERYLGDQELARLSYHKVVSRHPKSPDAVYARELLQVRPSPAASIPTGSIG